MALLWRFQNKNEWGRPQKVIFLACTHASADFSRYTLYSSLSITQCKWQQWVLNLYFVANPANRRLYSMLVRMTCIYEPDDLTETRMELLAAVSTDSDLYLAKVGHHSVPVPSTHQPIKPWPPWPPWPSYAQRIIKKINALFSLSCFKHSLECTAFALCPRCPETAGTYRTKSSLGFTLATSESIS